MLSYRPVTPIWQKPTEKMKAKRETYPCPFLTAPTEAQEGLIQLRRIR